MEKIWEFFENMNELVYVSDLDSYELVYMNKKALGTYGFHSQEELAGKKCYEVLQNSSAPCAACNKNKLRSGYFREWEYYSPIFDKHFMLKATVVEEQGKRYRVEMGVDISNKRQQRILWKHQNLESIINEGIRVALLEKTPSGSIEVLLEYLGKALDGERTYIFEKNDMGGDDNTYEWVASGVTPEKDNLQNVPPEVCESWYRNFSVGKHIIIGDVEDIRESDPLQYETLKSQNIHSLVVIPLYDDGRTIGFYGVDNPPVTSLEYASNMLQIAAHFILSSLKRRNLVRELEKMSYSDQLTKIGNRRAMDEYIEHIQQERIGIVFCDMTGLKVTNDREGHRAGDRLLIRAGNCLKQVFGEYNLFRIGGDEFLVICTQIDENVLWEKVELLKKKFKEEAVEMAVGVAWEKESVENIDKLISDAEKKMYMDKAEYYWKNKIDRRRI